ncbi:hypothetical protein [Frankia sp. Cas4]|uniref:hypothetical protein n=1 Tax=Frankia sp. Cas4 TaxID=3073927 RepID=UPI002AD36C89|nr:hypothetical protein [Frankia sp. Cas4]
MGGSPAMVGAEVTKLRRRRSLMAVSVALTVGGVVMLYLVTGLQHLGDPVRHPAPGGSAGLDHAEQLLFYLAGFAGLSVGATAGTADEDSGVFRDAVSTGRCRWALFAARIPGVLAVLVPLTLLALAIAIGGALLLPGTTVSAVVAAQESAAVLAVVVVNGLLALGLAPLIGARGLVIGLLAGAMQLSRMLEQAGALGRVRLLLPTAGLDRLLPLSPGSQPRPVAVGVTVALVVVTGWVLAALVGGFWRTQTRAA